MKRTIFGRAGEDAAARWLAKKGYVIIKRNHFAPGGEIDIIALRRRVLHFIEVKTRSNDLYGAPADAVTHEKLAHIKAAARDFIIRHPGSVVTVGLFGERRRTYSDCVVDVVEVYMQKDGTLQMIVMKNELMRL